MGMLFIIVEDWDTRQEACTELETNYVLNSQRLC
jgi:hypothetical protein